MLGFHVGQKLFCVSYVHHKALMVSGGARREDRHIILKLLLYLSFSQGAQNADRS